MNYLPRTIQPVIEEASKFFKIVMVSGMRQVGKSTLLKQLSSDKRTIISFDDISNLEAAKSAPLQFLQLDFSQVCERSSQWCELRYSQVQTAH